MNIFNEILLGKIMVKKRGFGWYKWNKTKECSQEDCYKKFFPV